MSLPELYVIGDSISIQYGPYLERFLRGVYRYRRKDGTEAALQNLDIAQGANAGDSSMVLSFLQAMHKTGGIEADILLLNCGLHDIKTDPHTGARQVPLSQYQGNLKAIIRLVEKMRPQLVWIRTTPCNENVHNRRRKDFFRFAADCQTYNAAADEIMRPAGIKSIDLYTFTANLGPDIYCDHVHFHEHIREKQAAYIAGWLEGRKQA